MTKEIHLLRFRLHAFRKAAITWLSPFLSKNGLCHFVPHVILHLMIYRLSLQKKWRPVRRRAKFFFDETKKTSASLRNQRLSYKSMDAYRGIFVLCTINGPCAWHQAIAGPINNKNLNAKLICDLAYAFYFFMQFLRA